MLAAALVSGCLQGITIMAVSLALDDVQQGEMPLRYFLIFILSLVAYFMCYRFAIGRSTSVALDMVSSLQMQLTEALRRLPLRDFEQLDEGLVYQEIIGNKDIIVEATRFVVLAVSGSAMMIVAFLFSIYISLAGFLVIVLTLACSTLFLFLVQHDVMQLQQRSQQLDDSFVRSLKDLIFGFTELKMNARKQQDLFEREIRPRAEECKAVKLASEQAHVKGLSFFTSFVFFPVGAIVFILPGFVELPFEDSVKLIGITLFSLGPLSSLVMALPVVTKAEMTLRGIRAFYDRIQDLGEPRTGSATEPPDFARIELQGCRFQYGATDARPQFTLDVDRFHLDRNEIVFLTGGNGSGKTSLMKVLGGLYAPQAGRLLIDGQPLDAVGVENYRDLFSIVLLNYHLFEQLYGIEDIDEDYCRQLLHDMLLEQTLRLKDGCRFSSLDLSSGQKKRLAVVAACLEKKKVLLFDEVAADFDPVFRKFFYEEFIPQLHRQGRTVLAISHDDRYYHVAHRVIAMEYGKITSETSHSGPGV